VSAASAWEIGTKFRLGKLDEARAVVYGYGGHLALLRAQELSISAHHALTAGTLTWEHRDPFDRVIAAQCMIESVQLVTADHALAAFPELRDRQFGTVRRATHGREAQTVDHARPRHPPREAELPGVTPSHHARNTRDLTSAP